MAAGCGGGLRGVGALGIAPTGIAGIHRRGGLRGVGHPDAGCARAIDAGVVGAKIVFIFETGNFWRCLAAATDRRVQEIAGRC
jgi:hypothetical protein